MKSAGLNVFSKIDDYWKLSQEIGKILKNRRDVSEFQQIFNLAVDRIYQDIMGFERENIKEFESDIFRLKKVFEKEYRHYFLFGEHIRWCAEKPFGYSGDFKIIDDIYQGQVRTTGFDRLWDNWFQQLAASKAVRERKEDFKNIICDYVEKRMRNNVRIMNLASGPSREIKELLETDESGVFSKVIFDCYDFDIRAIDYAKKLLDTPINVNFFQKNAIRLALKKNIEDEIKYRYDLIYSTGLFDYLDAKVAARLVKNLKKLLKPGGVLIVSNMGDKYVSSSSVCMEWIGQWYLIYRTKAEFEQIFIDGSFALKDIEIMPQDSNIMQYCIARK